MKKTLLIVCIMFSGMMFSQPVITNSVVQQIGNSSTFRLYNAEIISAGPSGANVTWDFSGINYTESRVFDYKDPSTMPGASTFPTANLGLDQNGDPQFYFIASSQDLVQIGGKISTLTEDYSSDTKMILSFPITYGNVINDTFEGTAQLATILASRSGTSVIEADGYGTLILPYATFNDALRVRTVSVYEDELLGNVVNSGVDTAYAWYVEGVKDYVFTHTRVTSNTFGDVSYGAYLDTMYVGINNLSNQDLKFGVSPNPASDELHISYHSRSGESLKIELFDLSGKLLKSEEMLAIKGDNRYVLIVSDLENGFYTLRVNSENKNGLQKVLINR